MAIDYSLYLVTDNRLSAKRSTTEIVAQSVAGGVSCVQFREKNLPTRDMVGQARELLKLLRPLAVPLIINDRIDVALAVGADGVHLGQSDMHISDARKILGGSAIIGISAESVQDGIDAERYGADYIGVSPVFSTATKSDIASPLGLEGVRALRGNVSIPLVGIGGIDADNAADVIRNGAHGIAVVSAIVCAECPRTSAKELLFRVRQGKRGQ